ncbi:MAG: hypothetical protein K2K45_09535 [Muribaculaceae bacterium]|nr:hypothetical protein [Muribaculaceae bacterium]
MVDSNLPADGLRFFHGLSNWVESVKGQRLSLIEWKKGQKALTILKCVKPKQKESLVFPLVMVDNNIYIPYWGCGLYVIRQLRNAFCHGQLKYDKNSCQYQIDSTDEKHIAGSFSLNAIREFVKIYLQPKETKKTKS